MVLAQDLRDAVLQAALHGKLTKQLETDSSVDELLNKIQTKRKRLILEKKIKKVSIKPIQMNDVPFEIPVNWKWQRIGSFEEINLGFTYRPQYVTKGVYFLSVKDISNGKIDFSNAKKVSQETYDNASYGSKPQKGDILFGRVCTMGKPQIIETDVPFCIFVSLGFFREHTNLMNKEYISYWMQSPLFYKQVNENVKGAAQKNLNTGWLKDFFIPIPPIEEQQRIVDKINELMEKIDEYENVEKELLALEQKFPDDMKNALLQAAMQGKLTEQLDSDSSVDEMLEAIKEEKKQLIKEKKIKKEKALLPIDEDEIPFDIPQNWRWERFANIAILNPRNSLDDTLEVSFIPMTLISDGYNNEHTAENRIWKDVKKGFTHIKEGDLGFAKITPCFQNRKSVIFKKLINGYAAGTTELHIVRIIPNSLLAEYLLWFVKSPYFIDGGVNTYTGTAGQQRIHKDYLPNCLVPIPPIEEQQRIVEKLEQLLPLCETL